MHFVQRVLRSRLTLHLQIFYGFTHVASIYANRPFLSSKNSHFQNEAKCETFVVKMSFICIIIKNHFHINGFALSLALKVRFFGTRKWPIYWNKRKRLHKKRVQRGLVWDTNMAAVSFFWDTNMDAMTSCENTQ